MKKLVFIILLLFFSFSFSQKNNPKEYTDAYINKCIVEIYGNKSKDLVFESKSERKKTMYDFMQNRIIITYEPSNGQKDYKSTNELVVLNKYNKSIKNDINYSESTFNPLKYMNSINLNAGTNQTYRIASSDYLMTVTPRNK